MDSNLTKAIQDNLEAKCYNIGNCVVALSAQGYVVNAAKLFKLKVNLILQEQLKYIDSFTLDVQRRILNLFNSIS